MCSYYLSFIHYFVSLLTSFVYVFFFCPVFFCIFFLNSFFILFVVECVLFVLSDFLSLCFIFWSCLFGEKQRLLTIIFLRKTKQCYIISTYFFFFSLSVLFCFHISIVILVYIYNQHFHIQSKN